MKFGLPQLIRFNAVAGAYSPITDREIEDSQLTATDAETELLVTHFSTIGEPIHVGNVTGNPIAARKEFRLFPTGERIWLNLVYPKPLKPELRLYLSKQRKFFPDNGDIWFIFTNAENELWIGLLPEKQWRALFVVEPEEDSPQVPVELPTNGSVVPVQDPALIKKRMELSKFRCEYDNAHKLFVARATGSRYVEVHHIIPKRYQPQFWTQRHKDLTRLDNLCCLCPWCHRAIHHGEEDLSRSILSKLFDIRSVGFHHGITKPELFQLYAVEEIVREDNLANDGSALLESQS